LGMTHFQAMRYVIIPQAIRVILPPVGNEFITLLKDSSLVSVVAVPDMVRRGREFMSANFSPIEPWIMIALIYLIMTLFSARVVTFIEKKSKIER
ncbi:MAG TPA: ABC transporter permease subunit, partial [Anaerolineaceae bacterium]|nr:ABC transporter permease subunit [Anaerolineaceae bacterium]